MKGDFSRVTFDPRKHYTGVVHQQGRVWLDADWNEDVRTRQQLLEQETIDVIGRCGTPAPGTAFQIAPMPDRADDFLIGGGPGRSGHFYVDGILARLDAPASYFAQPDYPNPDPLPVPASGQEVTALVYLEVWRRLITYLEDDAIREVALGGPDTAARVKTIAQVKVVPVSAKITTCAAAGKFLPGAGSGTLTTLPPVDTQPPDPCRIPDPATYTGRENHLYRVEIHDAGDVQGGSGGFAFQVKLGQDASAGAVTLALAQALSSGQTDALKRSGVVALSDDRGRIERVPIASISADGATLTLARGLQNVFLTADNAAITGGVARFKWSRDNASFAVRVNAVSADGLTLTLDGIGRDQATALRAGDLVEISDDTSELGPGRGHLTYLTANPDPDLLTVTLADPLPGGFGTPSSPLSPPSPLTPDHMVLRRWDGLGSAAAVFSETGTPDMDLGDGVHIQFGGSDLRAGDYWHFAARSIDGSIERLTGAPPMGILRHRCPLALVRWTGPQRGSPPSGSAFEVLVDCRTVFATLGDPGVHVTRVIPLNADGVPSAKSLENDTQITPGMLLGGIDIECDRGIEPETISRPTCFVTVDVPISSQARPAPVIDVPQPAPPISVFTGPGAAGRSAPGTRLAAALERLVEGASTTVAYQTYTLGAAVGAAGNVINWRPHPQTAAALEGVARLTPQGERGILMRLILKGNYIWARSEPGVYLDGDSFGAPRDGSTTALRFPSGDYRRGGTFETWFWLTLPGVPTGPPLSFTLTTAAPPIVRGEGVTELVSDLVLVGIGGTPTPVGDAVPRVTVQVNLSAPVTSPLLGGRSDIVLLIDNPTNLNTSELTGPSSAPVLGNGTGLDYKNGVVPNIFLGVISGNAVSFPNVPLDSPGTATRTLRIANLRAAANASAGGVAAASVNAIVSISGAAPVPVNNPQAPVALVQQPSSAVAVRTPDDTAAGPFTFKRGGGVNPGLAVNNKSTDGKITFNVKFRENFPTTFRDAAGESGSFTATVQPSLPPIGAVTNGTRLRLEINGVPDNVQVFVTTRDVPAGTTQPPTGASVLRAVLVNTDVFGGGSRVPEPPVVPPGTTTVNTPIGPIPIRLLEVDPNKRVIAVWECVNTDPKVIQEISFGVVLAAQQERAGAGIATVNGGLAPISTVGTAQPPGIPPKGAPVTRFVDTSVAQNAFSFV